MKLNSELERDLFRLAEHLKNGTTDDEICLRAIRKIQELEASLRKAETRGYFRAYKEMQEDTQYD